MRGLACHSVHVGSSLLSPASFHQDTDCEVWNLFIHMPPPGSVATELDAEQGLHTGFWNEQSVLRFLFITEALNLLNCYEDEPKVFSKL